MKFYLDVVGIIVVSSVEAHKLDQGHKSVIKRMNDDGTVEDDLASLMDKYDNGEKK